RSAADQAAIDVGHGKELCCIARLDAAAVENTGGSRDCSILAGNAPTDERVDLLRLVRRGIAAGADGPHRLVGDDGTGQRLRAAKLEDGIELARHHFARAAGLPVRQLLADTE